MNYKLIFLALASTFVIGTASYAGSHDGEEDTDREERRNSVQRSPSPQAREDDATKSVPDYFHDYLGYCRGQLPNQERPKAQNHHILGSYKPFNVSPAPTFETELVIYISQDDGRQQRVTTTSHVWHGGYS